MRKFYSTISNAFDKLITFNRYYDFLKVKFPNRILVAFFVLSAFALSQQSMGQAASSTWTLTSSPTPVVTGNVTATAPTFGSGLTATGNADPAFGSHATGWPTSSAFTAATPATSTQYIQFSVAPTVSNSLTITSLSISVATVEFRDKMAIFYSTDPAFATSTQITLQTAPGMGNALTYSNTYSAFTPAVAASGQTLYFRVYYYGVANINTSKVGITSLSVSGTTSGPVSSITTGAISGSPFCAGGTVSVPFTSVGTYTANTYTAQLSNAAGSFAAPTNIGTLPSNANSGTITATIPVATATGAGYRIRVVSSSPVVTGSDNGTNITITALPVATFSYAGTPYCQTAANPSPTFSGGGVAGTFTSTAGLVFVSVSTGQINLSASTPGTYTVTNTIAASGGCGVVTATSSITITALPVATFSYAGTPYCRNAANPLPTFSGGGVAGTFTSTAGLVFVSAATGQINLSASTPGTYTVTNTIAASGGCGVVTATSSVTITALPVATFSYAGTPYCQNGANPSPTFSGGGVAGTFTSTAGLVFVNAATGQINLSASTPGTYTVTNTIAAAGGCGIVTATTSVIITALPVATFSYAGTPYCQTAANPSPTFSGGGVAGTFTAPAALSINSATGQINLSASTAGTYTVTNTIAAAGGCAIVTATTSVTITALPVATFSYAGTPYCQNGANPLPAFSGGGVAGTFTSTAGLVFVSATTGQINLSASTPGTYTVTNTIAAASGCAIVTATSDVTITALPVATFSYAGTPYCQTAANPSPTFSGGVAGTFTSTAGLVFVSATTGQIDLSASTAGTYIVTNTIAASNGCALVTATTSVTITALPVATFSYAGTPYCQTAANPLPTFSGGGVAGNFTSTAGLVFVNAATGQVNLSASTPGTYTVTNTIAAASGCAIVTATSDVNITALPVATFSYTGTPYCLNGANPSPSFSGGGVAGTFTSTAGLVFVSAATGQIDLSASTSGTYIVTNTIAASNGCAIVTSTSSVTINQPVVITADPGPPTQTVCATSTVIYTVTATGSGLTYQWLKNGSPISNGGNISGATTANLHLTGVTLGDDGDYSVTVSGLSPCASATSATATLVVNQKIIFTAQPVTPSTICQGQPYAISASATGTIATSVWNKGGVFYANAVYDGVNTYSLTIPAVVAGDAGTYQLVLDDGTGIGCTAANSNLAVLNVNPIPDATATPASQTICSGNTVTTIALTGSVGGTTYAWTRDMPGVTGTIGNSGSGNISGTLINSTSSQIPVTFTVTPTASGCVGTPIAASALVNPTSNVTNTFTNPVYCNGDAGAAVAFTSDVTGATFAWTSTADVGFGTSGSGNIASYTATNAGNTPVTATVTVIATNNSCAGPSQTYTVTVNPTSNVTNTFINPTYCNGVAGAAVNFTSNVAGSTFAWTSTVDLGFGTSGSGSIPAYTATNATNAAVTATITVTATANTCSGSSKTYTVTVNPTSNVTNTFTSPVYCNGDAGAAVTFTSDVAGATFAWTSTANVGFGTSGSGNIASYTATNAGNTPVTATVTVIATNNGCPGPSQTYTVTVNPTSSVTNTFANPTYCNGAAGAAVAFTSNVAGSTFAWTSTVDVGFGTSGSGNIPAYTATNATNAAVTATITVTATANSCSGSSKTYTVTVNPTSNVTNTFTSPVYCNGDAGAAVTFTSNVTGATFSWTSTANVGFGTSGTGNIGAYTATNATNAVITATVTVTATNGGCPGPSQTYTVTVNPTSSVTNTFTSPTYCNGVAGAAVNFTSNVVGATFAWTSSVDVGFGTSGSGNIPAYTATNATNAAVTATITVIATNGGCSGSSKTFTVTVNPTSNVTNTFTSPVYCAGATGAAVTFTSNVAGATFAWTSSVNVGFGISGTGNIASYTAANAGNTPLTSTITVTAKNGACTGPSQTYTVTVNPTSSVTNTFTSPTYCNGAPGAAVTFTSNVAGATFAWTSSVDVGFGTSGSGNIPTYTATNATNAAVTSTVTVTATNGGCSGSSKTFTVKVNPTSSVTNTFANPVYCAGATGAAVTFTSNVTGATYTWTSSINVGFGTSGTGNIASYTAANATNAAVTSTVTVTATNGGCPGPSQTYTITVNPTSSVTNIFTSPTYCNGAAGAAVTFTSNVTGATFSWTSTLDVGFGTSGSGNIPTYTATNATNAAVTATITVIATNGGCNGSSKTFTVKVNPTPNAIATPASQTKCSGIAISTIALTSSVAGTSFTWTRDNTATVTGIAASGSGNITGTLTNTTASPVTVTFTITPSANTCGGATITATIIVNPLPTITPAATATPVCFSAAAQTTTLAYSAITQSPTTYSINYNNAANAAGFVDVTNLALPGSPIIINIAGGTAPGTYTGSITVQNANGCSTGSGTNFTVTINPLPTPSLTNSPAGPVCANTNVTYTSNAGQSNYVWTFSGTSGTDYTIVSGGSSTSNTAVINWITPGTETATVNYANGNGCMAATATSNNISILALPTGNFTAFENSGITPNDNIICKGDNVTFSAPPGYASYIFYVNGTQVLGPSTNNLFNTTTLNNGDQVTVSIANSSNCGATFGPIKIIVNLPPSPTLSADKTTICQGDMVTFTAGGGDASSVYTFELNGSPVQSGASNVYTNNTLNNNDKVTVILTDANKCSATYATPIVITVNSLPAGTLTSIPNPAKVCAGSNITFTATSGFTSYEFFVSGVSQGVIVTNTFSSSTLTNGSVVTVKATNSSTCSNTFNAVPVTIYALPTGTLAVTENSGTPNDNSICAGAPVTFTVTPSGASNYAFYLNGTGPALQSGTSNNYISTTLANGDYITVTVSNANSCQITLTSPAITVIQAPTGSLVPSPSNTICAGSSVMFTADAGYTNYNFKIGGTSVQNGSSNTYTSTSFADGNVVTVDVTNSNGCIATFGPITMHVNALPSGNLAIAETSGLANNDGIICAGATVVFTATSGFSNYNFLLNGASIQTGSSNVYTTSTLNNNDIVTVTVTNGSGCVALFNSYTITVNPLPTVAGITGTMSVCVNSTTSLSDATTPGIWSTVNPTIATVDPSAGVVSGMSAGTATINYTFTDANVCSSVTSTPVTVNPLPTVAPITGNVNICIGGMSQLSDATSGGSWSAGNGGTATVDPTTGIVTGEFAGPTKIYYSVSNMNGCTGTDSITVNVTDAPSVDPITTTEPSFDVCEGGTLTLMDATSGGVWSSQDPATATINSSGVVTGVASGTVTIDYTITTSCSQVIAATKVITVNTPPSATISYTGSPFCTTSGVATVNQMGTTGGTYSYTGTGTLTIDPATGAITLSSSTGGTYNVIYTVAAAGGCAVFTTNTSVTITQAPSTSISYDGGPFCTTSTPVAVNFTGTTGGTYSYTGTGGTLVIDPSTGTITPSSSDGGTYTVIYTVTAAGCNTFTTNTTVTITTLPTAIISYAGSPFCTTSGPVTVTQGGTSGGTYSYTGAGTLSLNTINGTITPSTSTGGTYTVSYTVAAGGGCAAVTATASVTITAAPTAVAGPSLSTCSNSGAVNITTGSSATNQSSVLWTSSGTGTFANANSLTNATYTPSVADTIAGFVNLTLTVNGNGSCGAVTSTKILTINAIPTITVIPTTATICQGSIQSLTATSATGSLIPQTQTFPSGTINVPIPDATRNFFGFTTPGEVNTPIVISGIPANAVITNITVILNASENNDGDLNFNIQAPNNNILNLVHRRGGSGNNFTNTIIAWNGGISFGSGGVNPPFTGTYSPDATTGIGPGGNTSNVSSFSNLSSTPNGTWTLYAEDAVANGSTGSINSWSVKIDYTVPVSNPVTWSPVTDLYTDAGATIPYTGQSLTTVFAEPSSAGNVVYTATATNASGCTNTAQTTLTVTPAPVVSISADYCIVPGKVVLTASSIPAATSYIWGTGGTNDTIQVNVAGNYSVTVSAGGCPSTGNITVAQNLVVNGDFSQGNVGFTSDYAYKPDLPGLVPPGQGELYDDSGNNGYSITPSGQNVHINFWGYDHTTESGIAPAGNFMAVNGHGNTLVIWKETVNVLPNTTYYFSAWAMSLNKAGNNAQLQFSVNGTLTGTTAVLANHCEGCAGGKANDNWTQFYGTWTSGSSTTTAVIYINDLQSALSGNDFGLDDINFGTLSPFIYLVSAPGTDGQTPCVNTPITPIVYSVGSTIFGPTISSPLPAGLTGTFTPGSGLYTITGTPTVAGNYTYTLTTTGTCNPTSATGTINIQSQTATLSSGNANPVQCKTVPVSIGFTLGGTATNATATGLPGGVTGSTSGNIFTITGTPDPTDTAGIYQYSIITSGSCTPDTLKGTITLQQQTITHNSGDSLQTVCINTPIDNIIYTISGPGSLNGTVTGLPGGVSYTYNSGILIVSGTPNVTGTFKYYVTGSGGCADAKDSGVITITPDATLTLTSATGTDGQTVCINSAITEIDYTLNNATNASVDGLPAGVTGSVTGGVFTITGTPTVSGIFNYTVTTTDGCGTATATGSITVQSQTIELTTGNKSPTLCQNTAMAPIVFTIGGTATGATLSGQPAGVNGVLSGNTFTVSGTPSVSGTFQYIVTVSGSCATPAADTGTITVTQAAIGGNIQLVSTYVCGGGTAIMTLMNQVGTIVSWESSVDGGTTWTANGNTTISETASGVLVPTLWRVEISNGCGNNYSDTATVGIHNYWTGGTSIDWNTASNWSDNTVPSTSCPDVYIPGGTPFQPTLGTGTATITNLHIYAGGVLTVTGATLQIGGTISNAGTFIASNGTIELNGTSAQTVPAATFQNNAVKDLIISNAVGVTLGGEVDVYESLTYGIANGILNTGGFLTLKSTATQTAWIGNMTGETINGNVTVERYIDVGKGHGASWEFVATPTQGQTVYQSWMENGTTPVGYGTQVTSPTGAGFDAVTPGSSLKSYVYTTDSWLGIPNTAIPVYNPEGYMLFVRGDRSVSYPSTGNTTLRTSGALLTPANPPPNTTVYGTYFASIGNPYASAVYMSKISAAAAPLVSDFFYVWDPTLSGSYGVGAYRTLSNDGTGFYVPTPSGGGGDFASGTSTVESGQAFFMQAAGPGNGTVSFDESMKASGSNLVFRGSGTSGTAVPSTQLRANLYGVSASTSFLADGNMIQYNTIYSDKVDGFDAKKLVNSTENFGIISGGKDLVIERRTDIQQTDTIFYTLTGMRAQNYKIVFTANGLSAYGLQGFIEDTYLKTRKPLNMEGTTEANFAVTSAAGSYAANRFRIVFAPQPPVEVGLTFITLTAQRQDANIAVNWKVQNEKGMQQYEVEKSMDGVNFTKVGTVAALNSGIGSYQWIDTQVTPGDNYYRIRCVGMDGSISYSTVVEVSVVYENPSIAIYPNPITDGIIHLQFVNQPQGRYGIRLLNSLGQLISAKQIEHPGGDATENIQWNYYLSHGVYQLEVIKPDGSVKIIKVLY